ncbi:PP2C family protein-serine/threonine phosphatase, partial [Nonomuraea sp. NPDC051941]|uniref:PP2C family protein-serine/threonine phosphatase n=1 Tax=Nonomuraea sp. NPDC051941 TaxID=3364373 RepID=UPI0037CC5E6B
LPGKCFHVKPPRNSRSLSATLRLVARTRAEGLLRGAEFFQITTDHTIVQSMVDQGRLTPEEATTHPQRSLLLRALSGAGQAAPDIRLHDARPGDRYLLCSDGLSAVVPPADLRRVLAEATAPEEAVRELVALANRTGGPDNVSCVVADVSSEGRDHTGSGR